MKAYKVFIKPFEAPQKMWKEKFNLIFSFRPGLGREGLTLQKYKKYLRFTFEKPIFTGKYQNLHSVLK